MNTIIRTFIVLLIPVISFAGKSRRLIFSAPYTIEKSHYDHLQVFDMRTYKDDLGFLTMGNVKTRVALVTANPLSDELSAYFFNSLTERPKEKKELVLVLHDLWVEDDPWLYSVTTIHFDGDFYSNDNGQYTFLSRINTLGEYIHNQNPNNGRSSLYMETYLTVQSFIHTILSECAIKLPISGSAYVSQSQMIQKRADERSRYSIFHSDTFRKGVYYSIEQFLDGKPVDTPIKMVPYRDKQNNTTSYKTYYASQDGKPEVPLEKGNFFALYNGSVWLSGQTDADDMRNEYADSMYYQNGNFYRVEYLKGKKIALTAPMTLLLGVIVTKEKDVKVPYLTKFDPESGNFMPITRYYQYKGLTLQGAH